MGRDTGPTKAKGFSRGGGSDMRRIVVSFDTETFEQVRQRALAEKCSFADQVRLLVEFGLEAA